MDIVQFAADHPAVSFSSILILGVGAQWLAWRLHLPSILLLLVFGFVAGPLTGFLNPDLLLGDLLFPIVSLSVGIILFEGGLSLKLGDISGGGTRWVVRHLLSIGVLVTWVLSSAAAYYLIDGLGILLSVLLGAIVIVSGPTVVIPLLRFVRPSGRVASILKWEGILIDPVGATIALLVFEGIFEAYRSTQGANINAIFIADVLWWGILTLVVGTAIGALGAAITVPLLERGWVPPYLRTALTLTLVLLAYSASNLILEESGLMAATIMGVILGNQSRVEVHDIVNFKEELGILLLSFLFIVLSARVRLDELMSLGLSSFLFLGALVLVIRPIAVWLSTIGAGLEWRERIFLAWLAPRGIVAAAIASLFAFELDHIGFPGADRLVPIVFLVVVGTVAIYGITATPLARWLDIIQKNPQGTVIVGAHRAAREIALALQRAGFPVLLVDTNRFNVSKSNREGVPAVVSNILADNAIDQLPLEEMGRLLAMTGNNELNALTTIRFNRLFGSENVYQITSHQEEGSEELGKDVRGTILFHSELDSDRLHYMFEDGAVVRQTSITDQFSFEDFKEYYGDAAVPMFIISGDKHIDVVTADEVILPQTGDEIISLVDQQRLDHMEQERENEILNKSLV